MEKEILREIEEKLEEIKRLKMESEKEHKKLEEELKAVKSKYAARIQELKARIEERDKQIKRLMRSAKEKIFDKSDVVNLKNATLYHFVRETVRKARSVTVELLKKLDYTDGIRIEEYVDWEKIKRWPDERLAAIGTERVRKEEFRYELKAKE